MNPRAQYILDTLDDHFMNEVGIAVATPSPADWAGMIEGLGRQAIYGWSWPVEHDNPPMLFPFCAELIAEQTAHLSKAELKQYLDVIKWVGQSHILLWREIDDPEERQRRIEDELDDNFPGSLSVWTKVRLAVLDRAAAGPTD